MSQYCSHNQLFIALESEVEVPAMLKDLYNADFSVSNVLS